MSGLGSTYRIQLNGLGFSGALRAVPYLDGLGVQTMYVSPIGRARAGSTHGYDVIDPTMIDPALGTAGELESLLQALDARAMKLLVDIVPNHMAASTENRWFTDVLRHGPRSDFAAYFDIAWDEADGRIVLPFLDKPLSEVVAAGEIRVSRGSGVPELRLGDLRLPVADDDGSDDVAGALERQHYELVDWRVAGERINYRRFFDITDLIGVRQEDPEVFRATHTLVEALSRDERIAGFRVDHVDGLRDPAGYLRMLRDLIGDPDRCHILVEKVLARGERLPPWDVDGTTGYEFAADVFGLFVDPDGAVTQATSTRSASEDDRDFKARAVAAKSRAIESLFPRQLTRLVERLAAAGAAAPAELRRAVVELTAQLDVYRTYRTQGEGLSAADNQWIARAVSGGSPLSAVALNALAALLTADLTAAPDLAAAIADWQQLSGAVAAKGVEDTATYDPGTGLVAADVGAEPDHPWASAEDFHHRAGAPALGGRRGLATTSTHDSKRSEDVRSRLAVLSEVAPRWDLVLRELIDLARSWRLSATTAVDAAEIAYLLETLIGAWPTGAPDDTFVDRIEAHVTKAAREAKRRSSWPAPDELHEAALRDLAHSIITDRLPPARAMIEQLVADIEYAGVTNALSTVVLKAAGACVPDVYQGTERWSFNLVDPDNRRPVEFEEIHERLDLLPCPDEPAGIAPLLVDWRDGDVKLYVLREMLALRRSSPDLIGAGIYVPIAAGGPKAEHVVAFARLHDGEALVVMVPRLVQRLAGPGVFPLGEATWADTYLQLPAATPEKWQDALSGGTFSAHDGRLLVAEITETLPVAVLRGLGHSGIG